MEFSASDLHFLPLRAEQPPSMTSLCQLCPATVSEDPPRTVLILVSQIVFFKEQKSGNGKTQPAQLAQTKSIEVNLVMVRYYRIDLLVMSQQEKKKVI